MPAVIHAMETVRRRKATVGETTNSGKSGSDAPCYRAVCPTALPPTCVHLTPTGSTKVPGVWGCGARKRNRKHGLPFIPKSVGQQVDSVLLHMVDELLSEPLSPNKVEQYGDRSLSPAPPVL